MRGKKAIINIVSSLVLQVIAIICGLIVPRAIIQTFGSETNGLIASITQFLGYIILLESGVGPVIKAALYKPIANNNKNEIEKILKSSEKFFRKIAYIFIVYVVLLCIAFPVIMTEKFDTIYTASLVLIIAISTFVEYFFGMIYKLYLQAEQKTYIVSVIQIIGYILNTICIVILIELNCNIQFVKLAGVCMFALIPLLQNWYVKNKYNIKLNNVEDNYELKQKWDALAQHFSTVVHEKTDVVVLTIFTTLKDVSVYSVYSLIINGIRKIIRAFANGTEAMFGDMIAKNETEHLKKSFKIYELVYYTIITIFFVCTLLLIIPFVKVYTKSITDYNYILPTFACIIVLAEFIWSIRQPYNSLVRSKGYFKETKKGSIIEALVNIVVSLILVSKLGVTGVAIGTLVAVTIRTTEYIIYASRHILKRSLSLAFFKVLVSIVQILIIVYISTFLPKSEEISYMSWSIYACIISMIASFIVILSNFIIYKEDGRSVLELLKKYIQKRT